MESLENVNPPSAETVRGKRPWACPGKVQVHSIEELQVATVQEAWPARQTVDPSTKLDPVIVTTVLPRVGPKVGNTDSKMGSALPAIMLCQRQRKRQTPEMVHRKKVVRT